MAQGDTFDEVDTSSKVKANRYKSQRLDFCQSREASCWASILAWCSEGFPFYLWGGPSLIDGENLKLNPVERESTAPDFTQIEIETTKQQDNDA